MNICASSIAVLLVLNTVVVLSPANVCCVYALLVTASILIVLLVVPELTHDQLLSYSETSPPLVKNTAAVSVH